ncbi:MAG: CocE/NonD family hydrolase, partial [Ilumatobacteraceae bacterium]
MQDSGREPSAPVGRLVGVEASDGVWLSATLYLPPGEGPFATLLEALPYRKDDVTSSYADSYVRFVTEGEFAVLRLDLRGTGSSGGILEDEYTDIERDDLRSVMQWIAGQPWSSGRVGMFGTSYSGFNSLHMAMDGVPELGAIAAMYATDDRYTDDVHYCGGVLRALDLIDYPLYMVAMNALPPTPAVWGDGADGDWVDEWRRRIERTPPWIMTWLRAPLDSDEWRRGSIRLGSRGRGYERIGCPTMLIAGWADGYRNNTFRTIEHLQVPWRLLAGPWSHKDPSTARPGPNIDCDRELMAFFDEHLRDGPPSSAHRAQIFVRRPTSPQPDLELHDGVWVEVDEWPPVGMRTEVLRGPGDAIDELVVEGDVGTSAWNSCAGGLPWGQPLDQRTDNARSITCDWVVDSEAMLLGSPVARLRVRSSADVGHVSVKLCDVA